MGPGPAFADKLSAWTGNELLFSAEIVSFSRSIHSVMNDIPEESFRLCWG